MTGHDGRVTSVEVPPKDAPLEAIFVFASTSYFGYDRHGGVQGLQSLGAAAHLRWDSAGELPPSLNRSRAALFFEARAAHFGWEPDSEGERYVRELVEHVSTLSGGSVPADEEGFGMRLRRLANRLRGRA